MRAISSSRFRSAFAFVAVSIATAAAAQTSPAPVVSSNAALPPKLIGIAHVAIRVANLEASRAFYQKLGYAQPFNLTGKNGEITEAFVKIDDHQYVEPILAIQRTRRPSCTSASKRRICPASTPSTPPTASSLRP